MTVYTYEIDHGNESPIVEAGMQVNGGLLIAVRFDAALTKLEELEDSDINKKNAALVARVAELEAALRQAHSPLLEPHPLLANP